MVIEGDANIKNDVLVADEDRTIVNLSESRINSYII
jgi:hypothetical protein